MMSGFPRCIALVGLCAALAPAALAQSSGVRSPAPPPVADGPFVFQSAPTDRPPPYLPPGQAPEASVFLPPPPTPGSPADKADVAAYKALRAQAGSARWRMAAADALLAPSALFGDFACALGVRLDPAAAPSLVRLITRMGQDAGAAAARVKQVYKRPRPFVTHGGDICLPDRDDLAKSWSYPSGHSTYSWSVALVLAEIAPDRAAAILARARAYGESRVICGVHYVSDVEQGRSVASGVVAVLHADPTFLTDLGLARAEVRAARARQGPGGGAPDPAQCKAETDAIAETPSVLAR